MKIDINKAAREFFPHLTPECAKAVALDVMESFVKRGCPGAIRFPQPRRRQSPLMVAILMAALLSGCASYSKTGWYTPDSFNYTYASPFTHLDSNPPTHYFGLSWSLKDK